MEPHGSPLAVPSVPFAAPPAPTLESPPIANPTSAAFAPAHQPEPLSEESHALPEKSVLPEFPVFAEAASTSSTPIPVDELKSISSEPDFAVKREDATATANSANILLVDLPLSVPELEDSVFSTALTPASTSATPLPDDASSVPDQPWSDCPSSVGATVAGHTPDLRPSCFGSSSSSAPPHPASAAVFVPSANPTPKPTPDRHSSPRPPPKHVHAYHTSAARRQAMAPSALVPNNTFYRLDPNPHPPAPPSLAAMPQPTVAKQGAGQFCKRVAVQAGTLLPPPALSLQGRAKWSATGSATPLPSPPSPSTCCRLAKSQASTSSPLATRMPKHTAPPGYHQELSVLRESVSEDGSLSQNLDLSEHQLRGRTSSPRSRMHFQGKRSEGWTLHSSENRLLGQDREFLVSLDLAKDSPNKWAHSLRGGVNFNTCALQVQISKLPTETPHIAYADGKRWLPSGSHLTCETFTRLCAQKAAPNSLGADGVNFIDWRKRLMKTWKYLKQVRPYDDNQSTWTPPSLWKPHIAPKGTSPKSSAKATRLLSATCHFPPATTLVQSSSLETSPRQKS